MRPRAAYLLVCALLAALALPVQARAASDTEVMMEASGLILNEPDAPAVVAQWKALGVDSVRIQIPWGRLVPNASSPLFPIGFDDSNPNSPGYQWGLLDKAVNLVVANGMRPNLTLSQYGPLWASSEPARGNPAWKPNPYRYARFAGAVAARYGNRVDRYLLGNEPNQRLFLSPQLSCKRVRVRVRVRGRLRTIRRYSCVATAPSIYRDLVRAAYPAIKNADPGSQVLIGELAPIGGNAPNPKTSLKPLTFLRLIGCVDRRFRAIRTGRCRNFKPAVADGFGYHPYARKERPDQPNSDPDLAKIADLPKLFRTLDQLTKRRRLQATTGRFNLYITEYGYETNPPDPKNGVSLAKQAAYLQQSSYIAWANPRVKLISQYLWRDGPLAGPGGSQFGGFQSGLLFEDNRPKPALAVFPNPFFVDVLGSGSAPRARFWGQVRPGAAHTITLYEQIATAPFAPIATEATDQLGYWTLLGRVRRGANYQFGYESGARSAVFHVG